MTPDDVAAIRAQAKAGYAIGPFHVMALIDALEAAWEDIEVSGNNWARNHALMRERAERAEAELHGLREQSKLVVDRAERAEAALARVRALCDEAAIWTEQGYGWTTVDEILAGLTEAS